MEVTKTDEFDVLLRECSELTEKNVTRLIEHYKRFREVARYMFRGSGIVIILLSVSIPYLAAQTGYLNDVVLPVASLIIAGLTGLSTFFQWQSTWASNRVAILTLEHWMRMWELKVIEAKQCKDPDEKKNILLTATQELFNNVGNLSTKLAQDYYSSVPNASGSVSESKGDNSVAI